MARFSVLILAGDGIGPEVMAEVERLMQVIATRTDLSFDITHGLCGGASFDRHGVPLTEDTLQRAKRADAVLLGAVGGPAYDPLPFDVRPEAGLLALRRELGLFANLRPAIVFDALVEASTLKPEHIRGLNLMIVRELTGGVYFGEPRGIFDMADGQQKGINTQVYTTSEIDRVARVAFDLARGRSNRVCSVEKANVMESGRLWRQVVSAVHQKDFPDVQLTHMYADNCGMQLVRYPRQFDVIVTDNLFGDMLSDQAAMLTGSLGMLPSASLGAVRPDGSRPALYEPVHGSAPDIAGQGKANPIATLLSFGMMLRWSCRRPDLADALDQAVEQVLAQGLRTADIAGPGMTAIGTREMGSAIAEAFAGRLPAPAG